MVSRRGQIRLGVVTPVKIRGAGRTQNWKRPAKGLRWFCFYEAYICVCVFEAPLSLRRYMGPAAVYQWFDVVAGATSSFVVRLA